METSSHIIMGEVIVRFEQKHRLSGQLVSVFDPHLSAFNQPVLLERTKMVGNQLLAFLKTLGQFGLRWELAQSTIVVKQVEDFPLEAVGVGRKQGHGEVLFPCVGVEFVGQWIESDKAAVILSPHVFFGLKHAQVVRDLPVAHVQRTHEGTEMASRVCRQVSHKATSLVPSIRGFVCFANQTEEPQASCSCWKSQPFVGECRHDKQRKNRSGNDNGDYRGW